MGRIFRKCMLLAAICVCCMCLCDCGRGKTADVLTNVSAEDSVAPAPDTLLIVARHEPGPALFIVISKDSISVESGTIIPYPVPDSLVYESMTKKDGKYEKTTRELTLEEKGVVERLLKKNISFRDFRSVKDGLTFFVYFNGKKIANYYRFDDMLPEEQLENYYTIDSIVHFKDVPSHYDVHYRKNELNPQW